MDTELKKEIRRNVATQKRAFSHSLLTKWSNLLWEKFETSPLFRQATTILLYHSLPDEVCTHEFIEKWNQSKKIVLPVMTGNDLELKYYTGNSNLHVGNFQIKEPNGIPIADYNIVDLALIPGISFDTNGNRLGRGKGFYDRLLRQVDAPKIGICFHFQLRETLPIEPFDIPMNQVWSEQGRIY